MQLNTRVDTLGNHGTRGSPARPQNRLLNRQSTVSSVGGSVYAHSINFVRITNIEIGAAITDGNTTGRLTTFIIIKIRPYAKSDNKKKKEHKKTNLHAAARFPGAGMRQPAAATPPPPREVASSIATSDHTINSPPNDRQKAERTCTTPGNVCLVRLSPYSGPRYSAPRGPPTNCARSIYLQDK